MNEVAIITGSSGGIGSALVKRYLDEDFVVIGLDRTSSKILVSENFVELNIDLLEFSKDINYQKRTLSEIKAIFPKAMTNLVLINNAAEQILKNVEDITWQDWEDSLAVNTVAPFFLAQGLIKELEACHGHIVNISSIHAKLTKAKFTCYAASKAAIEAVTRSLALELSPIGISVNAIAPAAISTEMLRAGFKEAPEKLRDLERFHPSQSIGTPDQISLFIKAITDQRGGFLTGAVLEFDGAISARLHDP
jgi:NAD(P)-dependent dehydrogenase (short-subunit alcohol dehydrogenase family)